ncbi:MAG: glucose-6-phosphate dehydrogenase [Acidobacteriota bacterium]
MSGGKAEPALFVIFGGTGDLAKRKLLPELARALHAGGLENDVHVVGVAPTAEFDDASYYEFVRGCLEQSIHSDAASQVSPERIHYHTIGDGTPADYAALGKHLDTIETEHELEGNRVYYLALPPPVFPLAIRGLGEAGMNQGRGWRRLVIEKPFGKDLETAQALNNVLHRYFDEKQVYRIDHYLGKDTVQNLLVLRFANSLLESAWSRDRVHSVQITACESIGVGTRAGYYDQSGCMKDMIQNHLMQVLTLVAMEVPSAFEAEAIRYEKVKVLRRISEIKPEDVVFGQYTTGRVGNEKVPGYLDEPNVPDDSKTETFVAMKLMVDSWRWSGVPFYLWAGKRLPYRSSRIAVRFKPAPVSLFEVVGGRRAERECLTDVLVIKLQPDEGFSLHVDVKRPGEPFALQEVPLSFDYDEAFEKIPGAYQTLLLDVLEGNQTLFVHADEVEGSWKVLAPVLNAPPEPELYRAGEWGPKEAAKLAIPESHLWQDAPKEDA